MSHLRSLAIGYAMATTLFAAAQAHSLGDRAQLHSLHYGSKATGTPPVCSATLIVFPSRLGKP